ncbi:ABC transporter permease [Haloactinomyces albus]|uniref:ABC transport system permease protein n=1 Tax=Haloactinomyces albus TaxID=1352928 RepID=A0AAE4CN06_9ACTN|nr:ABC transporter permease [Haloactinomyces albus]MDR7302951.1 putative ABC transport system permease protein [Haloactinomyces albus]
MFVAWRDLRFARGRFALVGSVVVLMTVLVGMLSGLTAGLGRENISAITGLQADHIAFAEPPDGQDPSFAGSIVHRDQWRSWAQTTGVASAAPVGIATTRARAGDTTAAVSAFGVDPAGFPGPATRPAPGSAVLSHTAAEELGVGIGDRVTLGKTLKVDIAAVEGDASYSHAPVVWTSLRDWQQLAPRTTGSGSAGSGAQATVIALSFTGEVDTAAADAAAGTRTVTRQESLRAIGSYTAENGSLQLMRGFLFAISALVIGAFFTVWTVQRSGDIAVLKALGASTGYLLRDALGQALLLLLGGTAAGGAIAAGAGAAAAGTVPFVLDLTTTVLPALVMVLLGAAGAALAVRRITTVDPLTALGSAR